MTLILALAACARSPFRHSLHCYLRLLFGHADPICRRWQSDRGSGQRFRPVSGPAVLAEGQPLRPREMRS